MKILSVRKVDADYSYEEVSKVIRDLERNAPKKPSFLYYFGIYLSPGLDNELNVYLSTTSARFNKSQFEQYGRYMLDCAKYCSKIEAEAKKLGLKVVYHT